MAPKKSPERLQRIFRRTGFMGKKGKIEKWKRQARSPNLVSLDNASHFVS
jgi:hypothetical protein